MFESRFQFQHCKLHTWRSVAVPDKQDVVTWRSLMLRHMHMLATYTSRRDYWVRVVTTGGSVAEWLACWTQAQKARVQIAVATLSGNSLRQTAHTHCASVHQSAKLVAALLRVAGVTAGLAESNGSLPSGLWFTSPAGWLPRTGISSENLRSVIEYWLPLPFLQSIVSFVLIGCAFYKGRRSIKSGIKVWRASASLEFAWNNVGLLS